MLAKFILAVTMAASALMGGGGPLTGEGAMAIDGYYLHVDELGQPSVWAEANGKPGLQTQPTTSAAGPFRLEVPPDNRVLL